MSVYVSSFKLHIISEKNTQCESMVTIFNPLAAEFVVVVFVASPLSIFSVVYSSKTSVDNEQMMYDR